MSIYISYSCFFLSPAFTETGDINLGVSVCHALVSCDNFAKCEWISIKFGVQMYLTTTQAEFDPPGLMIT